MVTCRESELALLSLQSPFLLLLSKPTDAQLDSTVSLRLNVLYCMNKPSCDIHVSCWALEGFEHLLQQSA